MKIVPFLIDRLVPFLTEPKTFARIRGLVESVENLNVPGSEKKRVVLEHLQAFGVEMASWLFNVLLELAVVYLKTKQGKI